ncbi:hypothetical protein [Brevibacillus sp. MS2.2]|uniref:hypothetical protein n=1 Tax=Brevibacillus sp. MS2.2 TaxID=2738981 RepID=UPI0020C48354|nr:hypothetical protein [Brevibacillus sp. MS2.2]
MDQKKACSEPKLYGKAAFRKEGDLLMKIMEHLHLEHFRQMEQLELQYYDAEFITPYQESYNWYLFRPDSVVAIEENRRIIAFMNLLPVKPHIYLQIAQGTFKDSLMTTADIEDLTTSPEQVYYFLSCVVVDQSYRKSAALPMMLHRYLDVLAHVEQSGCRIQSIIMDNITEAGNRFAQRLNMKHVCISDHDSHIHASDYESFKQHVHASYPMLSR